MAKFEIIIEDNNEGVSVRVSGDNTNDPSAARRIADVLVSNASLIARIPVQISFQSSEHDSEVRKAMQELRLNKPTIH